MVVLLQLLREQVLIPGYSKKIQPDPYFVPNPTIPHNSKQIFQTPFRGDTPDNLDVVSRVLFSFHLEYQARQVIQ